MVGTMKKQSDLKRWGASSDLRSTRAGRASPGPSTSTDDEKLAVYYESREDWAKAEKIWDRLGNKKRAAECRKMLEEG
jgi:hypothetical protein